MKHNLEKRLEDLERQQSESVKIRLVWYDEECDEDDPSNIRLKWYDERGDEP